MHLQGSQHKLSPSGEAQTPFKVHALRVVSEKPSLAPVSQRSSPILTINFTGVTNYEFCRFTVYVWGYNSSQIDFCAWMESGEGQGSFPIELFGLLVEDHLTTCVGTFLSVLCTFPWTQLSLLPPTSHILTTATSQ